MVGILYCVTCAYRERAERAAAALHAALGIDAVLIKGHSGRFEVEVDGTVILAKGAAGFPDESEIVGAVARALSLPIEPLRELRPA